MLQRQEEEVVVVSCHCHCTCRTTMMRPPRLVQVPRRQRQRQLLGSIIIIALSLLFCNDVNVVVFIIPIVERVESFTPPYQSHYYSNNNAHDLRQQQQQQHNHSRITQLLRLFSTSSSSSSSLDEIPNNIKGEQLEEKEEEQVEVEEEMLLTKKSKSKSNRNSKYNDNDKAPLLITIGPPCSNKKLAIESYLLSEQQQQQQQLGTIDTGTDDNGIDNDHGNNDNNNNNNESDIDLNYEIINLRSNSIGVYHRIPLAAYIYPESSHLTDEIGNHILYDDITVKGRLLRMSNKYEATDIEIRNVCLRLAGRITRQEFATRIREIALQAGDTVEYFKQRRILIMEDLINAVEEVTVEVIGEVIMENELKQQKQMSIKMNKQMELQQQKQQQMNILKLSELLVEDEYDEGNNDNNNNNNQTLSLVGSDGVDDLPYEEEGDDDDNDDDVEKTLAKKEQQQQEGTTAPVSVVPAAAAKLINATTTIAATTSTSQSAHLLSARALIKTPYVELYVPQNIFNDGIRRSENQLYALLSDDNSADYDLDSNSRTNMVWMNTNSRPSEYVIALNAAQQCNRPVKFIFWGGCSSSGSTNTNDDNDNDSMLHFDFPIISRKELLKNNIRKFRNTGRYKPAGAIGGSLDRIENFIKTAEEIATKAASAVNAARDNRNNNTTNSQNNDEGGKEEEEDEQQPRSKKETTMTPMTPMMMMDTAFAYLGGFHINMDTGLVKKVGECKQLKQPFPFRKTNTSTRSNTNNNTGGSKYPKKRKKTTIKIK